jgi:hypothetical protein
MKHFLAPVLMLAALVFSGCESTPGEEMGRLGPPPAKTRTFQADPRAVYDAARVALAQMSFRVTGGGPAQGRIEAVSGLSTGDSLQSTRQISISIQITPLDDGSSEVSAELKEAVEEDSADRPGFATETRLKDTPYYDVFFNGLGQALVAPKKD